MTLVTATSLALWLFLGLICLMTLKPPEQKSEQNGKVSYRSVISNKTFLLYLIPWFLFSLINDLTMQINTNYFSNPSFPSYFANNYLIVENILAGAVAIIFGFLADKKGRKRLALIGFALLGTGYASLGLFYGNHFAAWFYVCADGVAWGAFSMLFLVTLWGDIANGKNGEKYYVLGILPYLFSNFIRFSLGAYISQNISESTVFSFASFFLFVSILPLVYAPETLSDKIIRHLDLNSYVNEVLDKVEKENSKKRKSQTSMNPPEDKNGRGEILKPLT
jgi:MFS family permease